MLGFLVTSFRVSVWQKPCDLRLLSWLLNRVHGDHLAFAGDEADGDYSFIEVLQSHRIGPVRLRSGLTREADSHRRLLGIWSTHRLQVSRPGDAVVSSRRGLSCTPILLVQLSEVVLG